MKEKIVSIFYLFLPLLLGTIIGILTSNYMDYSNITKPLFSPPGFIFPIVWTILYLLMGLSYFVIKKTETSDKKMDFVYYLQLFFNLSWSIIFFVFKFRLLSVIWVVILDILVIYMIYLFYKKIKLSAYLNIPYLIWILFATYLTIGIFILN
ncbi:MAG: tryptophan-rich sensory protein [Firmicutes bacterium]|nr:tryptophan-rich sensory protein [Bacillota bacterium]